VPVGGEGHVAFQDTRALPGGGPVRFDRVLRELQRRAAMADRKFRHGRLLAEARHHLVLERTVLHPVDQIQRAHTMGERVGAIFAFGSHRQRHCRGKHGKQAGFRTGHLALPVSCPCSGKRFCDALLTVVQQFGDSAVQGTGKPRCIGWSGVAGARRPD
jgi:hypothetical protein